MSLNITFKNLESTDAIKAYVEKKTEKFRKYVTYPMEVHVILSVAKGFHTAEITSHAEFHDMVATSKTEDLYESIDSAVAKIETQLKKEREKKKGHTAAHKVSRKGDKELIKDVPAHLPHQGKVQTK